MYSTLTATAARRPFHFSRNFSTHHILLSGHNKWSKIREKKGATDARKSAVYGKAHRDILVSVRNGGSADPQLNATLASVLQKAKVAGVPKDNIEKALAKAAGDKGKNASTYVIYEALVPGNVGVLMECLSDNTTRTNHKLRQILTEHDARYAPVKFMFQRKGCVQVALQRDHRFDENFGDLWEIAIEAGAEDFEEEPSASGDLVEIQFYCPPQALASLTAALSPPVCQELLASELVYKPNESDGMVGQDAIDSGSAERVFSLVQALEDHEDILRVWTTIDGHEL